MRAGRDIERSYFIYSLSSSHHTDSTKKTQIQGIWIVCLVHLESLQWGKHHFPPFILGVSLSVHALIQNSSVSSKGEKQTNKK